MVHLYVGPLGYPWENALFIPTDDMVVPPMEESNSYLLSLGIARIWLVSQQKNEEAFTQIVHPHTGS